MAESKWKHKTEIVWAVILTALAQGVVMLILDILFKPLVIFLTKFENHKTKVKFENSYVIKMFLFRFVNNYGSLIFIAYVKKYTIGCINWDTKTQSYNNDCMIELKYQLLFIFLVYLL